MNADELRARQAPCKERYRSNPASAIQTLRARGRLGPDAPACTVETPLGPVQAGLHPAAGGDGSAACAGDMLLQALVACAGVTLTAVATALGIPLRGGSIEAEGDLDFRGTLAVDRSAPVGFTSIRLDYRLDTDADEAQRARLIELTERYCVVYQTIRAGAPVTTTSRRVGG